MKNKLTTFVLFVILSIFIFSLKRDIEEDPRTTIKFLLFILFYFLFMYFIVEVLPNLKSQRIKIEENSRYCFKVGKNKIFFSREKFKNNFEEIYKNVIKEKKNSIDMEYEISKQFDAEQRHNLIYKFLLNKLKKLGEEEFLIRWAWFRITDKDVIKRELGEILYFYVTMNKIGTVSCYGNRYGEFWREDVVKIINTKKISFSILHDDVDKIIYYKNNLILKTKNIIYNFNEKYVFINDVKINDEIMGEK